MTALLYLFARLNRGGGAGFDEPERSALSELYPRYRRLFAIEPSAAYVFLFRVLVADASEVLSLRRPLDEILVIQR